MIKHIYILLLLAFSFGNTINIPSDYPSIQEGIDAASDGDTILVHPGTYYGPIDFERKNLVVGSLFMLEDNESFISQTIIMGTDTNVSPFVQIDGISEPEVELNGFTFQDISLTFGDEAQSYALINILNASPIIINNHFNNFYIDGQAESAVILCNNSSSLIGNNIFSDGMIALNYELTGWILSKNSSLNIKNNLMENGYVGFADPAGYVVSVDSEDIITENTFNNISMGYCYTCAAIVILNGSNCIISNNLILRATGDGYGAIVASESQYVSNNNTLVSNRGGYTNLFSNGIVNNDIIINYPNGWGNSVTLDAYSTLQISYSNIEGGYEGEGNIDISPLFSDAENDDYSLQSASSCIDAGTADLDGDGIDDIIDYYGLAPDMGAYEYESEYDCNEGFININHGCYYQQDIDVLTDLIDNSNGSINMILDESGDGVIEPLELCDQEWIEGRLTSIDCSPIIIDGNYNWLDISGEIPSTISNWSEIQFLSFYHNDLSGIVPNTICSLDIDFSDPNTFSLYGNNLCPPYPECVEDDMGSQSNWGAGACEIGNCYDIGVTAFTAVEENGDNLLNTYDDTDGIAHLLVNLHNDGPDCSTYPGLMITAELVGIDFPDATSFEPDGSYTNWWYAMFADDTYFSEITFEISPFVPIGTEITFTARAIIMGCLDEGCSEDPYCHDCPLTDPVSITLTVGDLFPSQLGDANTDSYINILDVVLLVSFILNDFSIYYPEDSAMQIYLSNINQDSSLDVLDIVMLVDFILNS